MNDKPFSNNCICATEGVKSFDKFRMLEDEFHPRSGLWLDDGSIIVLCVLLCAGLGLLVFINKVHTNCRRFV